MRPLGDFADGDTEAIRPRSAVDHDSEDGVGPQRRRPPAGLVERVRLPAALAEPLTRRCEGKQPDDLLATST